MANILRRKWETLYSCLSYVLRTNSEARFQVIQDVARLNNDIEDILAFKVKDLKSNIDWVLEHGREQTFEGLMSQIYWLEKMCVINLIDSGFAQQDGREMIEKTYDIFGKYRRTMITQDFPGIGFDKLNHLWPFTYVYERFMREDKREKKIQFQSVGKLG